MIYMSSLISFHETKQAANEIYIWKEYILKCQIIGMSSLTKFQKSHLPSRRGHRRVYVCIKVFLRKFC